MSDGDAETQGAEALLDYLRQSRAVDFTGYKRSTLVRRISTSKSARFFVADDVFPQSLLLPDRYAIEGLGFGG